MFSWKLHSGSEMLKIYLLVALATVSFNVSVISARDEKRITVESLDTLEGVGIENIGSLKLVLETRTLSFEVNLTRIIEEAKTDFLGEIERISGYCSEINNTCVDEMNEMRATLDSRLDELKDIVRPQRRRKRAIFGGLSSKDGENIRKELDGLRELLTQMTGNLNEQFKNLSIIVKAQNASIFSLQALTSSHNDLNKRLNAIVLTASAQFRMIRFEEKIKAIYRVLVNRRMDSDLISVREFKSQLTKVSESLESPDKDMMKWKVRDYYNNLEARHKVVDGILIIEMDIPIIGTTQKTLFKISKVPVKLNNHLIMLNTSWSYVAMDSEHVTTFFSLDTCHQDSDGTSVCELQSPLHKNTSEDCLAKTVRNEALDGALCESMINRVEFTQLTFIKHSEGQYFYYTQNGESLTTFCDNKADNLTLDSESTGLLSLPPGCVVNAGRVTLMATGRSKEPPFIKENFLNIRINLTELDRIVANAKSPAVILPPLIGSPGEFDAMFKGVLAPVPMIMPEKVFEAGSDAFLMIALALSILIGVSVLVIYAKCSKKSRKDCD